MKTITYLNKEIYFKIVSGVFAQYSVDNKIFSNLEDAKNYIFLKTSKGKSISRQIKKLTKDKSLLKNKIKNVDFLINTQLDKIQYFMEKLS